jgi:hypothetical protein
MQYISNFSFNYSKKSNYSCDRVFAGARSVSPLACLFIRVSQQLKCAKRFKLSFTLTAETFDTIAHNRISGQ